MKRRLLNFGTRVLLLIVASATAPTWATAAAKAAVDSPLAADDVGNVRRRLEAPEDARTRRGGLALQVTVEAKTAYFFRGYNVMDVGYIVQPEAVVSLPALEWGNVGATALNLALVKHLTA